MRQLRGKPLRDFLKRVERPPRELAFVLQDVEDPVNVGSAFRIADACGVRQVVLTGISARPPHPIIKKVVSTNPVWITKPGTTRWNVTPS